MSQNLTLPNGDKVTVDRVFIGADLPELRERQEGKLVIAREGRPAPPAIAMRGKDFFYLTNDLAPVSDKSHVEHLPQPFRAMAEEFIDKRASATKPLTQQRQPQSRKKAGAKKRTRTSAGNVLVIEDEETLKQATGGVTVK